MNRISGFIGYIKSKIVSKSSRNLNHETLPEIMPSDYMKSKLNHDNTNSPTAHEIHHNKKTRVDLLGKVITKSVLKIDDDENSPTSNSTRYISKLSPTKGNKKSYKTRMQLLKRRHQKDSHSMSKFNDSDPITMRPAIEVLADSSRVPRRVINMIENTSVYIKNYATGYQRAELNDFDH